MYALSPAIVRPSPQHRLSCRALWLVVTRHSLHIHVRSLGSRLCSHQPWRFLYMRRYGLKRSNVASFHGQAGPRRGCIRNRSRIGLPNKSNEQKNKRDDERNAETAKGKKGTKGHWKRNGSLACDGFRELGHRNIKVSLAIIVLYFKPC